MPKYMVSINGKRREVVAEPDTPLLWVLRDNLRLFGTKYGCGEGVCGACTVMIGSQAKRSCLTPISEVGSEAVTTVEGLSADGTHPLQKAWMAENVPQCGYCQAGQLMSAAALLKSKPKPTDADIDSAMSGNMCRCGQYNAIRAAIHRAAGGGE